MPTPPSSRSSLANAPLSPSLPAADSFLGFAWPHDITPAERKSLLAGGLGWMLDAMDVMLYSLVLAYLIHEFAMSTSAAGFLNSLTLIASALGGLFFGLLADRIGRTRALMASILVYSFASAACGFSRSIPQLATFRFLLGLGMGGEWTSAAALIAETWRAEHRGKALGLMQSAYAIGEAIAALVVALLLPHFGWRAVFFVGVLPALLVFWVRRSVPEPVLWKFRRFRRRLRPPQALLPLPGDRCGARAGLRDGAKLSLASASRVLRRLFWHRLFCRLCGHRERNFSWRDSRYRDGTQLQRRPRFVSRRAVCCWRAGGAIRHRAGLLSSGGSFPAGRTSRPGAP